MKKEQIINMIDKKIIQSFSEGLVVSVIQEELVNKKETFIKVVQSRRNQISCNQKNGTNEVVKKPLCF